MEENINEISKPDREEIIESYESDEMIEKLGDGVKVKTEGNSISLLVEKNPQILSEEDKKLIKTEITDYFKANKVTLILRFTFLIGGIVLGITAHWLLFFLILGFFSIPWKDLRIETKNFTDDENDEIEIRLKPDKISFSGMDGDINIKDINNMYIKTEGKKNNKIMKIIFNLKTKEKKEYIIKGLSDSKTFLIEKYLERNIEQRKKLLK